MSDSGFSRGIFNIDRDEQIPYIAYVHYAVSERKTASTTTGKAKITGGLTPVRGTFSALDLVIGMIDRCT